MNRLVALIGIIIALTACTGSSGDRAHHGSKQPKREHELRFMREMGINPDSMLVEQSWTMPEDEDWETVHNRRLNIEKIQSLGLDLLFDADTAMAPVAIMAVKPIDDAHTIIIFHQYLDDTQPVHMVTYDADGIPTDHLNLGTLHAPNLQYTDKSSGKTPAMETATVTFADRLMTVARELSLTDGNDNTLWTASNTDTYEIDKRGYIIHRDGNAQTDQMPTQLQSTRALEATCWFSLQDEQAMDALVTFNNQYTENTSGISMALFMRLYSAPWSTSHWLYTHQDSPLVPILAKKIKATDKEVIDRVTDKIHDPAQRNFILSLR